jgi:hypothetical protein
VVPNTSSGTYTQQSGWLTVNVQEDVGMTGFGTLVQNGGTNNATELVVGKGIYTKNGGALFAGNLSVLAPSESLTAPTDAIMNHAGGSAIVTNLIRLLGQGPRQSARSATFNMSGGTLSTPQLRLEAVALFNQQSNSTVAVANELLIEDVGALPGFYNLSGGNLFDSNTTLSSGSQFQTSFAQTGGTHIITNNLQINGTAVYQLQGGTVTASNMVLVGNLSLPPQFFVVSAPAFTVSNQSITLNGGAIVMEDSAQQFGRLTILNDSGINLAGSSAILRFADSHTNVWQGGSRFLIFNWSGSTNGGGADQLRFGNSSSALTVSQLAQFQFINAAGFPAGSTNAARILVTGEVVPVAQPVLSLQNNGTNLVLNWSGNFVLQSTTNLPDSFIDVPSATSPFTVNPILPMQFFRLRSP